MGVLKIHTKDFLIEDTQLNGCQMLLLVQLQCAPEIEILNQGQIQLMPNHLRSKDRGVENCVVGNHSSRPRSNESSEIQENFDERATLSFSPLLGDAMNINRSLTDLKVSRMDDRIEGINQTPLVRKPRSR
jgi:hypothetical protein